MGIAYELQFFSDGLPVPDLNERAERLLGLEGQRFRVSSRECSPDPQRLGRKRGVTSTDSPRHESFLHLWDDAGEVRISMNLDSPYSLHSPFKEPGCFSVLSFGSIKHLVWKSDFEARFGSAFAEFMWSVSRAFNASRSYLYDDSSVFWRLNAHSICYHPVELYQHDVERIRTEWQRGLPWLGITAGELREHELWTFEKRENWPVQVGEWAARDGASDLHRRLQEVDYVLKIEEDTLQLLGFPGPIKGYVDAFFLI